MKEPLLSVVVAVYNVENYLRDCLLSLVAQTYGNIEILLVNDGSTDGSLRVAREFEATDSRIRIISKQNEGLVRTRQRGIEESKGEYVCFLDGDDYLDKCYLEKLMHAMRRHGCDCATGEMMKAVAGVATLFMSPNADYIAAEEFARGAADAGHQVEIITLRDKNIGFCRGCLSCVKTQRCVMQDDAADIVARMKQAEVIAFATPVYYFEMSGQMKTLLDRSNPLYTSDYAFRDIYLLASAAENDDSAVDGPINGLKGWIACFEKCSFKGAVRGVGATAPGDIRQHTAVLEAAYKMGRQA